MIKKLLIGLIIMAALLDARSVTRMKQVETAENKQMAIEAAHWKMFNIAMGKAIGSSVYDGNIIASFKDDMEKDFPEFKRTYFGSSSSKCKDLKEDGFKCLVLATIDIDQLKAIVAKKSNSNTTMGKSSLEDVKIVLINDVEDEISRDFTSSLQASMSERGAELWVEKKGTQVGAKGNSCEKIKRKRDKYKRKGASYKSALIAIDEKLQQCKDNVDVQHLFKLTLIRYNPAGKDTYGNHKASLKYTVQSLNTQTGRSDSSVRSKTVKSYDADLDTLKIRLVDLAAEQASAMMANNILKKISKKSRKKTKKKMQKFEYLYTVILRGITNDGDDRHKRKIIKETIKKLGAKARKNKKESNEHEQVYNFGSNEEVDTEEFSDMLYDMADSLDFRIRVTDKGDDIVVVQFL